MAGRPQRTPFSRVFTIEDGAGPSHIPIYQSLGRAQSPSWDGGDVTPIYAPSEEAYGLFDVVDTVRGAQGLPQLSLQFYYQQELSEMLRLFRKRCPFDAQVHMGTCRNPADFNGGWTKILALEEAVITSWGADELGALEPGEDAKINENVPLVGQNMYEIRRVIPAEFGGTQVVQEVVDIIVCDSQQCGECGISSDGCQVIFALTLSAGGSPGLPAEIIYSPDAGTTLGDRNVTTLGAAENPDALACIGPYLVVISEDSCSLHYALAADVLTETETWTEVATGFVSPTGCPRAMFSAGSRFTWIVGLAGYVYFTANPTTGVTVQNAGIATSQNLNAVHGVDELNVVAVGALNAVIYTTNGGTTWTAVTGPAVGVALNAIWMKSETEWLVGAANGRLYYTTNGGTTWTEKAFPGSGSGAVEDIAFSTKTVGWMSHTLAGLGRILRTVDGGYSWALIPETGTGPLNDRINELAACAENPNIVFGAGLGDNAVDGFLVKAA